MQHLRINADRLKQDVDALSGIGRQGDEGIFRMAFSPGDMEARAWLAARIRESGLDLHIDGAANIHARLGWDGVRASVMTGSHMDTVPGAGHLDGALGVLAGLECLRCMREARFDLAHPLECVAFTDEEGRFGGMFGSRALCGRLTAEELADARDLNGARLVEVMADLGLDALDALSARRDPGSIAAFVELHIEQGPRLDRQGLHLGVVDAIAGLFKWQVRLIGETNHAGTTPMHLRRDAFQGLAAFAGMLGGILEDHGTARSVATIGRVELVPGAANVVPGLVNFSLDVRDTEPAALAGLAAALRHALSGVVQRHELTLEIEVLSEIVPVRCDPRVVDVLAGVCRDMGVEAARMHSGAAHDAQIMAGSTRAGMMFVPSKRGLSHSPVESTAWEDIELGANALLNALYRLAGPAA